MIERCCAFTGHRPRKFPWGYNEDDARCVALKETLAKRNEWKGYFAMKQITIASFEKKFYQLVDCCVYVQKAYEAEIKEKNRDNPAYGDIWRLGGYFGALTYFLRSLAGEEKKINHLVLARIRREKGYGADIATMDYIDAAIEVLEDMGCHIPIPEDI